MDLTREAIDRIVELGNEAKLENSGDKHFIIAPEGFVARDVSEFFPPKFVKQAVAMADAASFVAYVNRYKTAETMIFASVGDAGGSFLAIIDYHAKAGLPGRTTHRATYQTKQTKEWETWMQNNGQKKTQLQFAEFLENNSDLFREPSGAALMELVLNLEGKNHVNFFSGARLQSGGNSLQYTEEVQLRGTTQSTTKEGSLEIPDILTAGISPFYGAPAYEVKARFKYRIDGKNLQLWYETIAPHKIMRDALSGEKGVVAQITEGTQIAPLLGMI